MSNNKIVSNLFNTLKYKAKSLFALLVLSVLFCSKINAQSVYYLAQEDFPNYEVHTGWPGTQTITGTTGTWTATTDQTYTDIDVLNYTYRYSSPNAIRMQNNKGASTSTASITSPTINLSSYSCSGKVDLRFGLYTGKLTSSACSYYKVEYSNNGGSTWTTAWQQTSAQILSSVSNPSGWNDITLLIGSSYLVSNFKYRITGVQSGGCGLNNEIWIDDALIIALACRTSWTNICTDNKDVDFYTKGMTNTCVNGSLGWTNIGTTEGLNMTNATQVKLYVSTSEQWNPTRTVTVRSKNASGAVVQTQTLSTPTSNQEDPSPINIYEFTFSSLAGVTNFEATVAGGCSLTNTSSSFVANGLGLAVFRSSVSGMYNTGELPYWGAPGNGVWDYYRAFTVPSAAYARNALITVAISGLKNDGKVAELIADGAAGPVIVDVKKNDAQFGDQTTIVTFPYTILAGETAFSLKTNANVNSNGTSINGLYSIDMVKISVPCTNPLTIGNNVFNDANNNGVKDGAEVGIAGVDVYLYRDANADNIPDGQPIQLTTTDASGNYTFGDLIAGNYIVGISVPNGYTSAITTGTSANPNNDTNNDNNGVTFNSTSGILLSNYITLTSGGEPTTDGDADNNTNLSLDFGLKTNTCVKTTESFPNTFNTGISGGPLNTTFVGATGTWGAYSTNGYSTVAVVEPYYSSNAPTLPGIKLVNWAPSGTDTWSAATSPVVNASSNCCPVQTKLNFTLWTYTVNVNDVWSKFSVDMSGDGGTTWTTNYTLTGEQMYNLYGANGKVNLSVPIPTSLQTSNFRYRFSLYSSWNSGYNFYVFVDDISISSPITCGTGSIGNYVWNDLNYNGTQDIGEVGISGVTVTLLDNNGSVITSTTTNASGNYTFSNLPAGTYQVAFTTPSGYTATLANQGADDNLDSDPMSSTQSYDPLTARVKNITLTSGQNRTDIDAGFFSTCSAIFTETFPNTFNTGYTTPTNGTFVGNVGTWTVASSSGYAGAVVESNGSTNLLKTINYYDASGTLSTVTITSPTGDIVTPNGSCTASAYLNFDMYPNYINTPPGSNAYKVYIDFSGNGGSTWTNVWAMNGAEILDAYGLNSTYNITIPIASAYYTTTFRFRLRAEQQSGAYCDNYILYDNFKIGKCPCPSLNLGNTVWIDTNGNGVKDGAEVGYNGATVKLYTDNNGDNTPDGAAIATTTTNASGVYAFSNLLPGAYIVGVTLPSGYIGTITTGTSSNPNNDTDNDNNGINTISGELRSNYITLSVGGEPASGVDGDGTNGNLTLDFGLIDGCTCSGNLLTNPSFETSDFTGWTQQSNDAGSTYFAGDNTWAVCGNRYAYFNPTAGGASDSTKIYQNVTASVGQVFTLSVYAGVHDPTKDHQIRLEFYNSSNVKLSGTSVQIDNDVDVSPFTLQKYTLSGTAPSGTSYVRVTGIAIGAWSGQSIALKVDAFCLTATTPTPTCTGNLISNTGFETGDFTSWTSWGNNTISTDSYSGTKSAQVYSTTAGGGFVQAVAATPYNLYTLQVYTKLTGGSEWASVGINFYDASWNVISDNVTQVTASTSYGQIIVNGVAPANAAYVGVYAYKDAGTGTLKVDDYCLTVTPYTCNSNLLSNPGLETGTLSSWTNNGNSSITTDKYAGTNAVQVTGAGGGISQSIAAVAGDVFTLRAFAKVTGTTEWSGLQLVYYNSSFTVLQARSATITSTGYQEYTVSATAPAGTAWVEVSIWKGNGSNTLKVDEFNLCKTVTSANILNLGNVVWVDINNDGTKGATEPLVSGATVNLYADANADNIPDGAALQTTITNASGVYNFTNLPAGNYIVGVVIPTNYSAGATTGTSSSPNNDTDNDNNGVTTVSGELRSNYITLSIAGEPASGVDGDGTNGNLTLDFGLKGSLNLGNLVWNDTNGNGVKDAFESGINGVTVYLYQDANGDNIPDGAAIATTTTSGAGIYAFSNLPAGNYIVGYQLPTGYANSYKPTNNANPNSDTDGDNNGVTTASGIVRSNYITLSVGGEPSTDGDGTSGNLTLDFGCAKDTDGDGVPDVIDIDDDNDGITDVKESGGYDPLADCDNDGVPNYLDSTPGCTTPSGNDAWGNPFTPLTWTDCNSDGINDFFDKDRDGIINELDLDSDNDGILDVQEARPGGVAVGSTLNGQITGTDADADGLLSSQDINAANPYNDGIAAQDLDRDGIPNFLDLDSDGDGINDLTEALNSYDADGILTSADSDGDGVRAESFGSSASNIADNIIGLGAKGISLLDTDGDGKPNAYDIDSDADGITDNAEGQATCSYILPTGTDCDKDGVDDAYEAGGSCACAGRSTAGVTPYDKDGDSTPDYLDSDTDGDGITDIYEGNTTKTTNYWTGSTGDADGDGLIDYFDIFNISSAGSNFFRNVVNRNMGTNGSFYTGTGGDGSASHLPESDGKDCASGGDRDWRNITILPTSLVSFTASLNNSKVANVKWTVTNEINMNSYTVERSVDGVTFKTIAIRNAINPSSVSTSINYTADDDLSSITNSVVYYRIKMTDKNNTNKYSNVVSFKLYDKVIVGIMVNPNPATTHFTLKVTSVKEEKIQVRIVDNLGKVMTMQSTTITSGVNSILFNDLTKFASGLYSVQVVMNGEVYTDKLIIAK